MSLTFWFLSDDTQVNAAGALAAWRNDPETTILENNRGQFIVTDVPVRYLRDMGRTATQSSPEELEALLFD